MIRQRPGRPRGFTLVELVCATFLLTVLAGIALPVAHTLERRSRELELKQTLRTIRRALDTYHFTVTAVPNSPDVDETLGGWPDDLDKLVEGIDLGLAAEVKVKFLRRIPRDPLTGKAEWGKRSSRQAPDEDAWDGFNVFDVFSLAEGKGLDGTPYKQW